MVSTIPVVSTTCTWYVSRSTSEFLRLHCIWLVWKRWAVLEIKETTDGKRYASSKKGTQKYKLENLAKVQERFDLKFGACPKISSSVHFNHWSCIWVCALLITVAMNQPFIWWYITIQPEGFCYERHKLGINRLGNIMKVMVDKSGLHGNKTIILHARLMWQLWPPSWNPNNPTNWSLQCPTAQLLQTTFTDVTRRDVSHLSKHHSGLQSLPLHPAALFQSSMV